MISGGAIITNSSLDEILFLRKSQKEEQDVMVIRDDSPDPDTATKGSLIIYGLGGGGKVRKSPYLPRIALFSPHFFRTYYLAPKESEMIDRLKFFAPP